VKKLNLETKVGIFFVICFALIAVISLKLGNYEIGETSGYELSAVFPSAAGINDETPALMAGLRVGMVTRMRLELGQARIFFKVKAETEIPEDSRIAIQSRGFLGAKYLEITPGKSTEIFKPGDSFGNVDVSGELSGLTTQAGDIAEDLKAITANLRKIFGGDEGEEGIRDIFLNLQEISHRLAGAMADNQENINRIMVNIEQLTRNIAIMSEENRKAVYEAMAMMPAIAENLNKIAGNLAQLTTDNNEELNQAVRELAQTSANLNQAMEHMASITRKVDEGEGTIGALVNDSETIDEISDTLDSINEFVGRVRRLQTHIDYRGEYWIEEEELKSYISLRLQPRMDKWYTISVVDDPFGRSTSKTTHTLTTTNPGRDDEETVEEIEEKTEKRDSLKLSATIAKRWHFLVLRGGILESEGGVGADTLFFDDHLRFSLEAFDFGDDDNPRLKANVDFLFLDHFLLTAGADDFIHQDVLDGYEDPRWFIGGGLYFRDDDISTLFTRVPLPDF